MTSDAMERARAEASELLETMPSVDHLAAVILKEFHRIYTAACEELIAQERHQAEAYRRAEWRLGELESGITRALEALRKIVIAESDDAGVIISSRPGDALVELVNGLRDLSLGAFECPAVNVNSEAAL